VEVGLKFLVVGLCSMGKRRVRNLQALGHAGLAGFDPREDHRREAADNYGVADRQPESFVRNYDAFCAGKGMLDLQDISGTLVFLLSDNARYVDGHNLVVDDGFSL
jgi:NAD(P)-dependent dehydrogenase (short-subunit alcohol dehydrogenase family)